MPLTDAMLLRHDGIYPGKSDRKPSSANNILCYYEYLNKMDSPEGSVIKSYFHRASKVTEEFM